MTFDRFSQYLEKLEGISARLEITAVLAELFKSLSPDEIQNATYLLLGGLMPAYKSKEFQLSTKMVMRALAQVNGSDQGFGFIEVATDDQLKIIEKEFKKFGDLGLVAERILLEVDLPAKELQIKDVYDELTQIADYSGEGSQAQKVGQLATLVVKLTPVGAKFVVRIVIGKLRLGFSTMTILDALSWATTGTKIDHDILEDAYQKRADIGGLASFYLSKKLGFEGVVDENNELQKINRQKPGQQKPYRQNSDDQIPGNQNFDNPLSSYTVQAGTPVASALCQRLNTSEEIIAKMGSVIVEPKYDGMRVQIHLLNSGDSGDTTNAGATIGSVGTTSAGHTTKPVAVAFTRNMENITYMFPEIADLAKYTSAKSMIIDSEAIGYDPKTNELLPFQETITRKRKHDIKDTAKKVPIKFFVFDLLELDGRSLIDLPIEKRKEMLSRVLRENPLFVITFNIVTSDPVELREYHEKQLELGFEGAVIKKTGGKYQSGRKGWNWVKIKETEGTTGKLSDTLDMVVLGYYFGKGKRTSLGIGAFLVGTIIEAGGEEIVTVAKIGTGLTEDQFRELKAKVDANQSKQKPKQYNVPKELTPDIWTDPSLVVEIAADEVTKSPLHTAGVALRFPRLVKFRNDKTWQEATTVEEIKEMVL